MLGQDISVSDSSLEFVKNLMLWQQYSLHGKGERLLGGEKCLALRSELTFLATNQAIDSM